MALVQTLSDELHLKVLGWKPQPVPNSVRKQALRDRPEHIADLEDRCTPFDLPYPEDMGTVFQVLEEATATYGSPALTRLAALAKVDLPIRPNLPSGKGWYNATTGKPVEHPPSGCTYLGPDFETGWIEKDGFWYPTCATCYCLEDNCWYIWTADRDKLATVVPWGHGTVVVNHNVQYDRQYLSSEYAFKTTGNLFFDTQSAWIAVRGLCNQMRPAYKAIKEHNGSLPWVDDTATNGLDAVYDFYRGQDPEFSPEGPLDKGVRKEIEKFGFYWSMDHLETILEYAISDVIATLKIFQRLYPEWTKSQPSLVSQTADLLMGSYWLPLSADRFPGYYGRAEAATQAILSSESDRLRAIADSLAEQYHTELTALVDQTKGKDRKAQLEPLLAEWVKGLHQSLQWLDWTPALSGKAKGLPEWYRDAIKANKDGSPKLTLKSRITPALFRMLWRGQPILFGNMTELYDMEPTEKGNPAMGYYTLDYGPIEHPEKEGRPCSCLFSKGFEKHVENGTLASADDTLSETLKAFMSTVNWVSMRSRVKNIHTEQPEGYPVTLPQILVTGTLTRRCADNLWQVASNPKAKRIGTELKSMIEAPKGYVLVGADQDSQEARLAGFLGDSLTGYVGSSALSLVVLAGSKKDKTDIHSVAAASGGVSRSDAKSALTFGTLYGQGLGGAVRGLMKCLPNSTKEECENKARAFLAGFKGVRSGHTRQWLGGTASYAFNAMEVTALGHCPKSPILGALMSAPLRKAKKDFVTTKTNWTIQTSGVDMRDLWVCILTYLFDRYSIDGRILFTIHDELWTCVKEEQRYLVAYLFQLASLVTNAYVIDALALDAIPASCAYHSAVNIDRVCRKGCQGDEYDPCVTPSQPEAIPEGEELDARSIVARLGPELLGSSSELNAA